jgi:pimeloyl-ACP methyl ester carboxylesterase
MIDRRFATRWLRACAVAYGLSCVAAPRVTAQVRDLQTSQLIANDGTAFEVTSGVVRVPEQRTAGAAARTGRTIDLAVARIRRTGAPASSSAHVILAGGPGDSGVDQVLGLARQGGALLADLLNGDLIGIDQRGTGRSVPNLSSSALYGLPLDQPGSMETWLPIIERVSRDEAARLRASGIGLEAYNTRESADDVNAVREALRYMRLTLWGRSYGTHLALATIARHPAIVERLILVSPEGLDHTWKLPSQVDAVLERLETRGAGDLVVPLAAILARLRTDPRSVAVTHPQTGRSITVRLGVLDVQWAVAQALGDPRTLVTLPAAIREMREGDFRRMAQITILRRERAGVQSAMKMMMDLSSGASAARRARIERETTTALLGNAINFPAMYLADAWGAVDLGDDFRRPVTSAVPTLILVGDLDPRTPVENAREVAATLSHATVVTLENATHQFDLFGAAPIREILGRFLRGQVLASDRIALPPLVFK